MDKPASATKQQLIIVRLLGGLGNQMFQYALGRHLSVIHQRPLKLDLSYYGAAAPDASRGIRVYGLDNFNIQAEIASGNELKPFQKYLKKNLFSRVLRHSSGLGNYYKRSYIFEPPKNYFVFDPHMLNQSLRPTVYLDGFWQTEKYFLPIESLIRRDFIFKQLPDAANQKMLQEISAVNSVSIHIRHGDNATKIAQKHGVLPLEYYYIAIKNLTAKISNPHFYVFSDDPNWAKNNLKLNFPATFVTHNGDEKNYEDLRLMSQCKHAIVGNSTFSWWGAWLGKKPGQLAYAPKRYHMRVTIPTTDLYPSNWELIEA